MVLGENRDKETTKHRSSASLSLSGQRHPCLKKLLANLLQTFYALNASYSLTAGYAERLEERWDTEDDVLCSNTPLFPRFFLDPTAKRL